MDIYKQAEFGKELKTRILKGDNYVKISQWAFEIYIEKGIQIEKKLDPIIQKLFAMEEGPEFILSNDELLKIANQLIEDS